MRLAGLLLVTFAWACAPAKESPIKGETEALLVDHDDIAVLTSDTQDVASALPATDNTSVAPDSARYPAACSNYETTSYMITKGTGIFHLRGCGSPAVKGDLNIRWEKKLALHVEIDTQGLFIGPTFIKTASIQADITSADQDRTAIWSMHVEGVLTPESKPRSFVIDDFKTLRWTVGIPCVTTDGTSTVSFDTRQVKATFSNFKLCRDVKCPLPYSHVRLENTTTSQFIDLRFNPDRTTLVDVNGRLLPIKPSCMK